jgi:hypothetical protein
MTTFHAPFPMDSDIVRKILQVTSINAPIESAHLVTPGGQFQIDVRHWAIKTDASFFYELHCEEHMASHVWTDEGKNQIIIRVKSENKWTTLTHFMPLFGVIDMLRLGTLYNNPYAFEDFVQQSLKCYDPDLKKSSDLVYRKSNHHESIKCLITNDGLLYTIAHWGIRKLGIAEFNQISAIVNKKKHLSAQLLGAIQTDDKHHAMMLA